MANTRPVRTIAEWLTDLTQAVEALRESPNLDRALAHVGDLLNASVVPADAGPSEAEVDLVGEVLNAVLETGLSADAQNHRRGRVATRVVEMLERFAATVVAPRWGGSIDLPPLDEVVIDAWHRALMGDETPELDELVPLATKHRPKVLFAMDFLHLSGPLGGRGAAGRLGRRLDRIAADLGDETIQAMSDLLPGRIGIRGIRRIAALADVLPRLDQEMVGQVGPLGGMRSVWFGTSAAVTGLGIDRWSADCIVVHSHVIPGAPSGGDLRRWRELGCPTFVLVEPSEVHVLSLEPGAPLPTEADIERVASILDLRDDAMARGVRAKRPWPSATGRLSLNTVVRLQVLDRELRGLPGVSYRHASNPARPLARHRPEIVEPGLG